MEESSTYGVSPLGLPIASVRRFLEDDVGRRQLMQQFLSWNISKINQLQVIEDILSIEMRLANRGKPIVVVNLARPEIADEFILKGFQWGETTYLGRKYIKEWSILQCKGCHGFGHESVSCTEGGRCNRCGQHHDARDCKSVSAKCVNCGGPHKATTQDCPQRENEARRLTDLAGGQGKWWTSKERNLVRTNQDLRDRYTISATSPGEESQREGHGTASIENTKTARKLGDRNQHTALLSPKPAPVVTAEAGKPNIVTVKIGDESQDQEQPGAIPADNVSQDDLLSDPRLRNIVSLLHIYMCPHLKHGRGSVPESRSETPICELRERGIDFVIRQQMERNENVETALRTSRQARVDRRAAHRRKTEQFDVTAEVEKDDAVPETSKSNETEVSSADEPFSSTILGNKVKDQQTQLGSNLVPKGKESSAEHHTESPAEHLAAQSTDKQRADDWATHYSVQTNLMDHPEGGKKPTHYQRKMKEFFKKTHEQAEPLTDGKEENIVAPAQEMNEAKDSDVNADSVAAQKS